jgi:hypothetical protein
MIIILEKSGGMYTARAPRTIIDTGNLKEEERRKLEKLIEESNFFDMTDSLPGAGPADFNAYRITIEDKGRKHSVATTNFTVDQNLSSIIRAITRHSKNSPSE